MILPLVERCTDVISQNTGMMERLEKALDELSNARCDQVNALKDSAMNNNSNPIHDRFVRLSMYVHKRQHGATGGGTSQGQSHTDPDDRPDALGRSTQWKVRRVVVLPGEAQREVRQNAGAMTANRAIIQGSSFDTGGRHFLLTAATCPRTWCCKKDDWIVFNDRHYDIESVDGLRVRHGLAGDRQGIEGRGGSIADMHDSRSSHFRSA